MGRYRITVYDSLSPKDRFNVSVFRMKEGETDTSDLKSWELIGEYENLRWAFFRNSAFKPSQFRVVGDSFNPVVLQNF